MSGANNRGALMEDWVLPSPSPRTLMSSFLNDEFSSGLFSNIFGDNGSNKPQDRIEKSKTMFDSSGEETAQDTKASFQIESDLSGANQKSTSHGGFAERMAARTGFGVLKIDTSRVNSSAPIRSPVTIPPGVSPRELLESPVFLPNAIAQPSPTTGKLPFLMPHNFKSTISSTAPKKAEDHLHDDCAFSFQPILRSKLPSFLTADKGLSVVHQNQSLGNDNHQELSLHSNSTATKDESEANIAKPKTCDSMLDNDNLSPADEQEESEENENGEYSSAPVIAPPEDAYNWRKYGQKQVKNSEHPRSYYKCTHPNCPVKKKVERSQEGHITEIVYKGSHSHPLPPPKRQSSVPLSHFNDLQADGSETLGSKPGHNIEISQGIAPNGHFQNVHSGILETNLSGSLTTTVMESRKAVDVSSTLSNEKDGRATHGSIPSTYDGDEDETESKRRKMDVSANTNSTTSNIDMAAMASRAVREPRIVVQTTSEVDILDDGYRWRKYGQKVVKGNPNPRSYYKCTHPGCSVRKHVERASNDLKSVITTYEGKHNHEVPAARNSGGHSSSGPGAAPQASSLHRRPEPAQGSIAQFGSASAYGAVCLPPQLSAASGGFCFGMVPPGMAVLVPSLGTAVPLQLPGHPLMMQRYPGLILPRGEMKVNPEEQSSLPVANQTATATYQQLMSRLPQGLQM
uniref:WRKY domain-containing protein n=1 Tax=Arundo donax TaxID=35708 RepID=A0A0A9A7V3_ARUDO